MPSILLHLCLDPRANASRPLVSFERCERGGVALIFALSMLVIVAVVGGAIDFGRTFHARTQTQNALDAAVLAGARVLQTQGDESQAIAAATTYFNQVRPKFASTGAPTFSVLGGGTRVRGHFDGTVSSTFLSSVSIASLPVKVSAEVQMAGGGEAGSNIEVAVMLDLTGSMCDDGAGPCTTGTKLNALKTSTEDLVNIVVWNDQSRFTSKVALVPFSTRVRVGPDGGGGDMMRDLTDLQSTWTGWVRECTDGSGDGGSEGNGNWVCNAYANFYRTNLKVMPCVTDRTGPEQYTDAPPGTSAWLNAHDGSRMPLSWDHSSSTPSSQRGLTSADPADNWNYTDSGYCADVAEANEIMPLSSNKAQLRSRIAGLEAYGSTGGALGTAWTWYMLSPNWSSVWPTESRPAPYSDLTTIVDGAPKLRKVAILMSDGEYNTWRGWKDQPQDEVSDRAREICTNMKATGIEVYTVGFGLDQLPPARRTAAETILRECGTSIDHFYNTLNDEQLRQAFREIALQIATIRLRS